MLENIIVTAFIYGSYFVTSIVCGYLLVLITGLLDYIFKKDIFLNTLIKTIETLGNVVLATFGTIFLVIISPYLVFIFLTGKKNRVNTFKK